MIEKEVEEHFVKKCTSVGWWCPKFTSPGTRAVPDRLVLLPNGVTLYVELKRPGGKPRPNQLKLHERLLKKYRTKVYVLDTKEGVDKWVKMVVAKYLMLNNQHPLVGNLAQPATQPLIQPLLQLGS